MPSASKHEGHAKSVVPVIRQLGAGAGEIASFGLDLWKAEPPSARYVADDGNVLLAGNRIHFLLGQKCPISNELRSALDVRMFLEDAAVFHTSCGSFYGSIETYLTSQGLRPDSLADFRQLPNDTTVVSASHIVAAQHQNETDMDCYHIPAIEWHKLGSKDAREVQVDAVIRIILPATLLLPLIKRLGMLISNRS